MKAIKNGWNKYFMDKYEYRTVRNRAELPAMIAQIYNLKLLDVQKSLNERDALGSVRIAEDIDLPHVELPEITNQGLVWVRSEERNYLVMVIDSNKPSREVVDRLKKILSKNGLNDIRSVQSQSDLDKLMMELRSNGNRKNN